MKRQKILVGYETDLEKGVTFAKYRKEIVEDDGSITNDGWHRETITQEKYDDLKRLPFADAVNLAKANALNKLSVEVEGLKKTNSELFSHAKTEIEKRDSELKKLDGVIQNKEAEIVALKKAKK